MSTIKHRRTHLSGTPLLGSLASAALIACACPHAAGPSTPEPPATSEAAAPAAPQPEAPQPQPAAQAETPPAPPATSTAAATPFHFDDLSHEDKIKHMKQVVVPTMKAIFQAYDAQHFAEFNCKTCHGASVAQGKFEMPNPSLPKLGNDMSKLFKDKPQVAKFMSEQVVPKMAELLGEEPYDPTTSHGFGCSDCHTKE